MCIFYVLFQRVFTFLLLGNFVHRAIVTLKSYRYNVIDIIQMYVDIIAEFLREPPH